MKLKKGKLYRIIWHNPRVPYHYVSMSTAYDRENYQLGKGQLVLYLGNRKCYSVGGSSWRKHKFLWKDKVVNWVEYEDFWKEAGMIKERGIHKTFELVETSNGS